ncbi:MAG: hypothetical protein A2X49_12680 [Lentisphaerae bacterium GWF2_52_8]|nr:MAG: hypothetical protein A2X49_12680 [Lentisphaerae bacterium GWF2_52_8]
MPEQLKITALSIEDLAKFLRRAGSRHASEDSIRSDIEDGAPLNKDGTVNLIYYCAWMIREVSADAD